MIPVKIFRKFLGPETAKLVAKTINTYIDQKGVLFYGNYLRNNEGKNFSTDQAEKDTHVLIGIEIKPMGDDNPEDEPIFLDPITDDDQKLAAEEIKEYNSGKGSK